MSKRLFRWQLIGLFGLIIVGFGIWFAPWTLRSVDGQTTSTENASHPDIANSSEQPTAQGDAVRVEVVKPQPGGIERTSTQPGTVIAYESARLYAKVSGYLKSQAVDIGDHVQQGQVLAIIDAPELLKDVDHSKAALEQARAQVLQADARVVTAKADQDAAQAAIQQAQAAIGKAVSFRQFREKQYKRIEALSKQNAIEQKLVDEQTDELESARAAEELAHAGVANAKAQAAAAAARVEQAKADAVDARANVNVAESTVAKAEVLAGYLQITSPYDGVITKRNFFRGDFVRSADESSQMPLLSVDRMDLMRVVVQVSDLDVPFVNPGNPAIVQIDSLPGVRFSAVVSRIANAEDDKSRTMRVEIDVPNENNVLRQGMYGVATIQLGTLPGAIKIPSSSLVGDVTAHQGSVYVCRHGIAHLVSVRVGQDNGIYVEILDGLSLEEEIVRHPPGTLFDGAHVTASDPAASPKTAQPTGST